MLEEPAVLVAVVAIVALIIQGMTVRRLGGRGEDEAAAPRERARLPRARRGSAPGSPERAAGARQAPEELPRARTKGRPWEGIPDFEGCSDVVPEVAKDRVRIHYTNGRGRMMPLLVYNAIMARSKRPTIRRTHPAKGRSDTRRP